MKTLFRKYRYQIELGILCFFMAFISAIFNRADITGMLAFGSFMVCGVIIPGTALVSLFRIDGSTRLETLLFSYTIGYIISMLVYSVTVLLELDAYLGLIYIGIVPISSIIIWAKKKDDFGEIDKREESMWIFLLLLLFLFSLIVFSLKNALPSFIEQNSWHKDFLYWLGDIASLTHRVPPVNFRTLDPNYSYHYFGALQIAAIVKTTGISVAELAIQYSFIEAMIMLGLSSLCLIVRVIKKIKWAVFTLFLLLFSTGFERLTGVTFFWHIYQIPMSFNIAISFEMIIILLLLIQLEKEKLDFSIMTYLLICLLVCTGTKGPSGAIALCGIGMACLYWLVVDKKYKNAFCYGTLSVIIFLGIYKILLMSGNSTYLENSSYVDPYKISLDNTLIVNCKIFFWKSLKYFRYVILINPWTFVPAGIYVCHAIIKRRLKLQDIIFSLMIVVGTVLGYVLHYDGNSEIYFTLAVFPFAAILAGKFWGKIFDIIVNIGWRIYLKKIGIVMLIFAILFLDLNCNWKNTLQASIRDGFMILAGISPHHDIKNNVMTKEEYEMYRWISSNTDFNALFLTDRTLKEEEFCYLPGAISGRYMYNIIQNNELQKAKECFQGDKEAIKYFIDKNIKYFIQSKQTSPNFYFPNEYGEKIFENETLILWQVKKI